MSKQENLFNTQTVPGKPGSGNLFDEEIVADKGPVVCLGLEFENGEARRAYFTEELRKKLTNPEFRDIEGFPIGEDEDILNLSDPPYYTACPNPWIKQFTSIYRTQSTEKIVNEPHSGDFTANNRHPVYSFHPYHTKVPPEIIRELICYYTVPNDLVLDVFCGTGMTGVAARESGRNVILNDLSPVATFISGINTSDFDVTLFTKEIQKIVTDSEEKFSWVYKTREDGHSTIVNYFVWTDVFYCPECVHEFPFFPHGVNHFGNKVQTKKQFKCPSCGVELNVRKVERILTTDGKKKALAWVNAGSGKRVINRAPNKFDLETLEKIKLALQDTPLWIPTDAIDPTGYSAKLAQLGDKGITDISRFLSERNKLVFADLWQRMTKITNTSIRNAIRSCLTSIFTVISERQGYFGGGGGMSGNLYMPIVRMEKNVYASLKRKIKKFIEAQNAKPHNHAGHLVTNQSATNLCQIPDHSIDYIYTDPPFGANIIYSEMNLILEGWLKVRSNNSSEAVIDETKNKKFDDYAQLMLDAFKECYRVLKPGKWFTVEFHNTQASVWNLIQNAIAEAGFVVAQVCKLDKGSTTILADIRPGAVVQDLIISSYKPTNEFIEKFSATVKEETGVWEFVHNYLSHLPNYRMVGNDVSFLPERDPRILFDQMVAYYVRNGYQVPVSNQEFQAGLRQKFSERDGMFFLPEQVAEYDRRRMKAGRLVQGLFFVSDESSAIEWLRKILNDKPQTFQDLHPQFLQELSGWSKSEVALELSTMLEQNFLSYDGKGTIPDQIFKYLSSKSGNNHNLTNTDPLLASKAKGLWYVPDPSKAGDLEKLREKILLKEFEDYRKTNKKLKVFRIEAVRAGFKRAWQNRDYKTIISVAEKIPNSVLEEDPKLLMWYDQAVTRMQD